MSGIGDAPSEGTRKKSKNQPDKTNEMKNLRTPQQAYDDDFDHMLDAHGEHHESLAGRLNSRYPNSLEQRHFALSTLHWKAHGLLPKGWELEL